MVIYDTQLRSFNPVTFLEDQKRYKLTKGTTFMGFPEVQQLQNKS